MLAEFVEGREYADDLLRLRAGGALAAARPASGPTRCATTWSRSIASPARTRASTCAASASWSATASASSASPTATREGRSTVAAGDRAPMRRMALEAEAARRTACARCTATSIPGTSCSARAPTSACSTARAASGARRPTTWPASRSTISSSRCSAAGRLEGGFETPVAALLGALPRALGRPRDARGGGAVLRLPRAGDGEPALVSGARRRRCGASCSTSSLNVLDAERFDPARANAYCGA